MKKLFLGLCATMLFGFFGNAQVKLSAHEKSVVDAQMISLVNLANATVYQRGMSQADFIKQTGPTSPNPQETILLQKMYKYASEGTLDCNIMKEDNSVLVTISQSGTISESAPANRWPWKLILEAIMELIIIFLPIIP
ncbi:MAG: hypothetical protein H7199_04570 [Burkholderiales bacterium]|nr:hypothetical protein [Flavobacterium sp.]